MRPTLRPVAETAIEALDIVRWTPDRPFEQIGDARLKNLIGRQADRVLDARGLEVLIHAGLSESGVAAKGDALAARLIPCDDRLEDVFPAIGAMDVSRAQRTPLQFAMLFEHEEWVVAGASEMPVPKKAQVGEANLLCIGREGKAADFADAVISPMDAEPMEVGIRPAKRNLERVVKIGERAIAAHQQPARNHRVDLADPHVDSVGFDSRVGGHDCLSLAERWGPGLLQTPPVHGPERAPSPSPLPHPSTQPLGSATQNSKKAQFR